MQLMMFSIPALRPGDAHEELNKFLRSHRILSMNRQLVGNDNAAFWAVSVEYLERTGDAPTATGGQTMAERMRGKVDYKEILSAEDFVVFARLREVRKAISEKEAVPPYAVMTNEQLAAVVTGKVDTMAGLGKIEGIGASRLEKYGAAILAAMKEPAKAVAV